MILISFCKCDSNISHKSQKMKLHDHSNNAQYFAVCRCRFSRPMFRTHFCIEHWHVHTSFMWLCIQHPKIFYIFIFARAEGNSKTAIEFWIKVWLKNISIQNKLRCIRSNTVGFIYIIPSSKFTNLVCLRSFHSRAAFLDLLRVKSRKKIYD